MDYEKEYKKLKGDIKKAYLFAQTDSTKAVLEDILPELKESEDEKIRKGIIKSITDLNTDWLELHGVTKENALAWLKSIKDRVQPQPKQEWSEEDGSHICQIIDWLSICKTYNPDLKSVCDISMQIDWLKSLKPKSHWKPSEEQMQILHKFSVPHAVVSEEDAKNLERIYADLKQL